MQRHAVALACIALVLAGLGGVAWARARIYRNPECRIRQLEIPRGWQIVPPKQVSYPRLVLVAEYEQAEQARLLVGVERVKPGTSVADLVQQTRALLTRQGWKGIQVERHGEDPQLLARLDGGQRLLRQAFRVSEDLAFVLTVITPEEFSERVQHDFDTALASLSIEPLPAPWDAQTGGPTAPRCK